MTNSYSNLEKINIQWYPGHMTKAKRMIEENIQSVDALCEILDARIPLASSNPDINELAGDKPRLIVLNRIDLADNQITAEWRKNFINKGFTVLETDAKSGTGINEFAPAVKSLLSKKIAYFEEKGQVGRQIRVMILGIPNVGKSTFINKLAGRKAAIVGDKPGVTRGKQWINLGNGIELLDTPGILWPKFEDQNTGELLAVTNAIKSEVFDIETLAANFMIRLKHNYPNSLLNRYKISIDNNYTGFELLEEAAKKRGYLISHGEFDTERMAATLLKEYHDGKLGRLSLERPNDL